MELSGISGDSGSSGNNGGDGASGDSGSSGTDGANGISGMNVGQSADAGTVPQVGVVGTTAVLLNGPMNVTTGSNGTTDRVINIEANHTFAGFDSDSISVDVLRSMKSTATAGSLLAADIDFFISGSPTPGLNSQRKNMFISSSGFIVTADGNVTASNIDLSGGLAAEGITATFGFFGDKLAVGGTEAVPNVIISASGEFSSSNFFVDANGNVTASNMKLQGGLEAESVAANYGFFGSALEVGGTQGSPRVKIGLLEGTAGASTQKYGIRGFEDDGTTRVFEVSEERVELAGWSLTDTAISGSHTRLIAAKGLEILKSDGINSGMGVGLFGQPSVSSTTATGGFNLFAGTSLSSVTSSAGFIDITLPINTGTSTGTGSDLDIMDSGDLDQYDFTPVVECFIAGTKIWMEDGTEKNIEDVQVGEVVQSYNVVTKQIENRPVVNLFTQEHLKEDDDLTVKLWFDNDTFVHATIANPFIVEGKEGVTAWNPERGERVYTWIDEKWNQLEIGDEIIFNNGSSLEKTKLVKAEVYYEQIRTYDIEVKIYPHIFC